MSEPLSHSDDWSNEADDDEILQRELDDQAKLLRGGLSTRCSMMSLRQAIKFNMKRQPMIMGCGLTNLTFEMPIEIRDCTVDQCREMIDELVDCYGEDLATLHDWWIEQRESWPSMTLAEKADLLSVSDTPFLLYNIEGVHEEAITDDVAHAGSASCRRGR